MKSKRVGHGSLKLAVCSALLSATTIAAAGPREASAADLARLSSFAGAPVSIEGVLPSKVDPSLAGTSGRHVVLARLAGAPVAGSNGTVTRETVMAEQSAFISRILAVAPSTDVFASMQLAQNAVILSVDAQDLVKLARDTSITRVVPVANYSLDLSETVPYIGGETAHELGAKGKGIRVAVIDSGVDYTHAALSGPGTQAAYEAAWAPLPAAGSPAIPALASGGYLVTDDPATSADDGLFPSTKVVGGYDFVGESWPNTDLQPDPDPIAAPDATTFGGHGTHVSDIIAGKIGVAPEAKIYAVKACSAPTSSCSGVALMQSMEFALDPNGDGNIRDRVDIINMSLGSVYGQPFDDDLSAAVDAASKEGVLTVASAGNSADKQFITGSPAAAASALSVAQTAVPSATLSLFTVTSPAAGDRAAIFQPWSVPLAGAIEGPVVYPPAGGKRVGCADAAGNTPYTAGELAGQIVLVDRGTCSFSLKIANIAAAGGILGIIGLITPDAPFGGAFGGGTQTIPGYMISQADADLLRSGSGAVRFDPDNILPLAGSLASTSSRGPGFDNSTIKPEIGAPGASVSAMSGSFTGTAAFGGTSGAAPMVSGAAALLMSARKINNYQAKQLLVTTGDPNVYQPSTLGSVLPDQLAPITRIGGGEVRVDRALLAPIVLTACDHDSETSRGGGGISFGYLDASKSDHKFTRRIRIDNVSRRSESYSVSAALRFQDDKDTGAVTMSVSPSHVTVPAKGRAWVKVTLSVNGSKLRNNLMSAGDAGNAIGPLTANEYDGYITFQGDDHKVATPWHILPRKSADVSANLPRGHLPINPATGGGTVKLKNKGVGLANIYAYSLLATGTDRPRGERGGQAPNPDIRAIGLNTFAVPAGVCDVSQANFVWEFVFNMFERKASPAGTWHEVDIDTTGDGEADFWVFNIDNSGYTTLSDGRQRVVVVDAATGLGGLRFFVEHATNSSNVILRVCGNDLGLTLADAGRPMSAVFYAQSWYFGQTAPILGPYVISPGGEEFAGAVAGDQLAGKANGDLLVQQYLPAPGHSPQQGLLLINNSDWGATSGNRGGATFATEALILPR